MSRAERRRELADMSRLVTLMTQAVPVLIAECHRLAASLDAKPTRTKRKRSK